MLRRRKIGPAYERSPLQRLWDWINRNLLILISSVGLSFIYCVILNFFVDNMFNFLATGGNEEVEDPFSSNDDMWILMKLVGSLVIIYSVLKAKSK